MTVRFTCIRCKVAMEFAYPWQVVRGVREHEVWHHGLVTDGGGPADAQREAGPTPAPPAPGLSTDYESL